VSNLRQAFEFRRFAKIQSKNIDALICFDNI